THRDLHSFPTRRSSDLAAKSWYIGAFIFAPLIFMETRRMIYALKLALVAIVLTVVYTMVKHAIDGFSFASINEAVRPFFRNHVRSEEHTSELQSRENLV